MPSGKKYAGCNIEGMIDKKEFNLRQNKTLLEVKIYSNTILGLKEKIEGFLSLLDGIDDSKIEEEQEEYSETPVDPDSSSSGSVSSKTVLDN